MVREEMCVEKGFKRDNGTDYYNHCVDVANTLISFEIKDEDVICAALLHDIIEDVEGYRRVTIAKMFNDNVARLVMLVTKREGVDYKQPDAIKEYLDGILSDMNSAAIKTADRMHNMMTLDEKTFEARYRKALETKTYYLPFFKQCRYMYPRYENLFYAARAEIEPLIFHIESFYTEIQKQQKELDELKAKHDNS
ncbi:MAG: HD domain-containing protein [Clostridia bacterium]|nr:HD domain-containing protein [Clostridia bacterium]